MILKMEESVQTFVPFFTPNEFVSFHAQASSLSFGHRFAESLQLELVLGARIQGSPTHSYTRYCGALCD